MQLTIMVVLIIFHVILQTVIYFRMLSTGEQGGLCWRLSRMILLNYCNMVQGK